MKNINRTMLVKLHMMVAAFILPVALMFFITGSLYTFGIKGHYNSQSYEIPLTTPIENNKTKLTKIVIDELLKRDIAMPSGAIKLKKINTEFYLEWTGSQRDISLTPTTNNLIATLKIKETTVHRFFVQLHKAKGGFAFKLYAGLLSFGLLFLFISGLSLAWQLKKYRVLLQRSIVSGLALFIIVINVS